MHLACESISILENNTLNIDDEQIQIENIKYEQCSSEEKRDILSALKKIMTPELESFILFSQKECQDYTKCIQTDKEIGYIYNKSDIYIEQGTDYSTYIEKHNHENHAHENFSLI